MPANNSRLNIQSENDFIRTHGEKVHLFRGMKCTCMILPMGTNYADPNRARNDCAACHGLGWVWIDAGEIIGLVSGIQQEKELLQAGVVSMGDLVFTPDLRYTLSDYDKVQLTWPQGIPFEGELITRGTGTTDETMYSILGISPDGCIQVNPTTGAITQYIAGVDFSYTGNVLTWGLSSNQPVAGSIYSLKYQALMDWIVFAPPQPRRERGTNLGQHVILRKKHVVFNGV